MLKPGVERDPREIQTISHAIRHRGPDDKGQFVDDQSGIALAAVRLSILDLSPAGHQPMIGADGSSVLVYNGELYNFRSLRAELEGLGHSFASGSDTEVVLRSLEEWGEEALERFCGMFALAFWQAERKRLLLARDPLGMKPLYIAELPGGAGMCFCSELKGLLALPDFAPTIDPLSMHQFLEFGYTFSDSGTALEGVRKLRPGHALEISRGACGAERAYFEIPCVEPEAERSIFDRQSELYEVLSTVVEEHLVADVPVGLLLSGGLDSSVVAALAARSGTLSTFSMGFADSEIDERADARFVAELLQSEHRELTIRPSDIIDTLDEDVWWFDDLFGDWGTLSTRLLYKQAREAGIKVVLVGEGADELFGGYAVFGAAQQLRGPMLWRLLLLYRRYAGRRYGRLFRQYWKSMRDKLAERPDLFGAVQLFESQSQLPNNYVMKVDKASMSVSVEARAPYLDRRVAEIALRTPESALSIGEQNKVLLRGMAEQFDLLPESVSRREKFGASIATSWMDESPELRDYARRVVLDPRGWVDELGLRSAMTDYFSDARQGYGWPRAISIFRHIAWRLMLLNLWSYKYLSR